MSDEQVDEEFERQSKVEYTSEICPLCNSRIDEYGLCACGAGGN